MYRHWKTEQNVSTTVKKERNVGKISPNIFKNIVFNPIGVNITAFGRKFMLFYRHPAFHLKCPAFVAYFELE